MSADAEPDPRLERVAAFLGFLEEARERLKSPVSEQSPVVQRIRRVVEEHDVDARGRSRMYQKFESAIYDDARAIATLWPLFDAHERGQLRRFAELVSIEIAGLTGDRHPRSVFDRSLLGIGALVLGTVTIWWTLARTFAGDGAGILPEEARYPRVEGTIWLVGLIVVLWYILKTVRNRRQVAVLATIGRALSIYLDDDGSS